LLPLFCGRKQWLGAIASGLACLAGLYSQKLLMPELYAQFQNSLHLQAEDMGDVGKGVFGIIFHLLHKLHHENLMLALAGHAAVAIVVLALLVFLRRRGYNQKLPEWPALIVVGILLITPRANLYDLCVLVPLVYGAAISIVQIPRAWLAYLCLFVISLPPIIYARDTILNGAVGSLTALGLFFAIAYKLSKLPAPEALQSHAGLEALQGSSIHG
jgi:peptidoglycan biosynthesis protein MviN/MurJ (putative lipid II flippase)